ncbi:MAG: threonine dehydratase [Rhodospirillaceae bacterium]|jgi:threonine dehydratase|nr:threonine dehydratase [Rhodospirillales bacterium]MBT3905215.1 threonine dehydratase [Rhodospirillaceae bacterium]MBT4701442.1 threonine dehydratase [Rhodospirillaceae bacterium]MBT5033344.1 threonine dehydratase [Rhodospirillaceae bacterium]MBT6219188.1 threonine dehydratase [Rhodospirillaceae bacterium]
MDFSPTLSELEHAAEIVYRHMLATPQIHWPLLSARAGCDVWVKHENHTPIGAFKVRGGLVFLDHLKRDRPDITGIISATRGNHGQSLAFAASRAGLSATIVVPKGNNPEKNAAMKALGAELIEYGSDFQEAYEQTAVFAAERNLHIIGPFEPPLIHGVATYSLEFLRSTPELQTVYVPIGMGSGISGMIAARDALGLTTKIVGVVAENAPAYALSFAKGEAVSTNTANTLADGVACRTPDAAAVSIINKGADRIVSVSEDEITHAMGCYFTDTHNLAEGAGAVPLAALLKEKDQIAESCVGLVLSGGNVDRSLFSQVLKTPLGA